MTSQYEKSHPLVGFDGWVTFRFVNSPFLPEFGVPDAKSFDQLLELLAVLLLDGGQLLGKVRDCGGRYIRRRRIISSSGNWEIEKR